MSEDTKIEQINIPVVVSELDVTRVKKEEKSIVKQPSPSPSQKKRPYQQSQHRNYQNQKNRSQNSQNSQNSQHSQKPRCKLPSDQDLQAIEALAKVPLDKRIDLISLRCMRLIPLQQYAESVALDNISSYKRDALIEAILLKSMSANEAVFAKGVLEVLPDGYGFMRTRNYLPGADDIYVSQPYVRRYGLATGDMIYGQVKSVKEGERYLSLFSIETINDLTPKDLNDRSSFASLTPIFPTERFTLERKEGALGCRLMDMMAPIGKGQRALIVSPPKAGKTTTLKEIANSIGANHPDVLIKVLLIDERPEEVTDMQRSVKGEVMYSTFDEPPEQHVRISELVLESAKREVESGKDVVILLDSITRLARAYNLVVPPSGRTLSGGLDPSSLHKPKRFFGGARNIEFGGSLTIIATALVDTGSRMDDIIYEEFKGTGNMELHLDRKLANKRIFPAMDVLQSGTRREDLLIPADELKKAYMLRKNISSENDIEELVRLVRQTESNAEFFKSPIFG